MESTTYGAFPFEDFRVPAPTAEGDVRLLDASQYVYSESMVGFDITGLRRTYIGGTGGLVVNGLLDPPNSVRPRGDRGTPRRSAPRCACRPSTRSPAASRWAWTLYGRDVHFSTGARLSLLQASPRAAVPVPPADRRPARGRASRWAERRPQRPRASLPT